MSRTVRMLAALSGLAVAMAPSSVPTAADTRRPEPREREPRLTPPRHGSGRFYRAAPGGYVSRQQRRAAERALNLWHLTGTFPRMLRSERRAKSRDTALCNELLVSEGVARFASDHREGA